jgi:heat shock protein HtpX
VVSAVVLTAVPRNGLRAAVLLGVSAAVIMLIGFAAGGVAGLLWAVVVAVGLIFSLCFWCDRLALSALRARPVSEVEYPELYRLVRELSTLARLPAPRIYVSPALQPNSLAVGRSPRTASVCLTVGLLRLLGGDELRGVIAHELVHVRNRDILVSSLTAGMATVITFAAGLAWFLPFRAGREGGSGSIGSGSFGSGSGGGSSTGDRGRDGSVFEAIMMLILGPVAALVIQLAVSRAREYRADASGARLAGDPLALASALRRIEAGTVAMPLLPTGPLASASHLLIVNPFRAYGFARLFSTHPPTGERVRRLEAQAGFPRLARVP